MTLIEKKEGLRSERGREWIFAFVKIQASECAQWCILVKSSMWGNIRRHTYAVILFCHFALRAIFKKTNRKKKTKCSKAYKDYSDCSFAVLSAAIVWYLTAYRINIRLKQ